MAEVDVLFQSSVQRPYSVGLELRCVCNKYDETAAHLWLDVLTSLNQDLDDIVDMPPLVWRESLYQHADLGRQIGFELRVAD